MSEITASMQEALSAYQQHISTCSECLQVLATGTYCPRAQQLHLDAMAQAVEVATTSDERVANMAACIKASRDENLHGYMQDWNLSEQQARYLNTLLMDIRIENWPPSLQKHYREYQGLLTCADDCCRMIALWITQEAQLHQ